MAWIESHQELRQHWKLQGLALGLGISRATALGHLHLLWYWAVDYASNGDLSRFTPAIIAGAAEWTGDPEVFYDALTGNQWVDEDGKIHDWWDYAGKLIEKRKTDRERKAQVRASSNGSRTDSERFPVESSGSRNDSEVHNTTEQNRQTEPTEEEGRVLVSRYLSRLSTNFAEAWGKVGEHDLIEIALEQQFTILDAGRMLGDLWEWWRGAPPSKRWNARGVLRGWRSWCKRERERREREQKQAPLDAQASPPPPMAPSEPIEHELTPDDIAKIEETTRKAASKRLGIPIDELDDADIALHKQLLAEEIESKGLGDKAAAHLVGRIGGGDGE